MDESFGNAHSQTRDGLQHVQVRGPLAGTNFGVLQVPGKARLNGTLEIETTGFSPALNAEVKVIEYGSRSGEFSDVTGAAIGNGLVWRVRYDPTGVTLVADNPPPTLLGTGVVLPTGRRLREARATGSGPVACSGSLGVAGCSQTTVIPTATACEFGS